MPKIPTIDAPDARPAGAPNASIHVDSRGAFGEAYGRAYDALSQAGGQLAVTAMGEYRKAQDTAVTTRLTKLQESVTDLGHNPDYGLYNRRGEDAINASEDYYAAINLKRQELQDSLPGDEAKRAFALRSSEMMAAHTGEVEKFVSGQRQQVYEDTLTLNRAAGLNAIRQDYGNDALAATQYHSMATAAVQLAQSDEARTLKLGQLKGAVTATRIQSALDQPSPDWQTAQRVYEQSGDTLGENQEEIRRRIAQARTKVTADGLAQQFVGAHLDDSGRPIYGAIQAEVDKMEPGPIREQVRLQTQERIVQTTRAYEQAENDRLGRALTMVERNGGSVNEASDDYQMLSPTNKAKVWEKRNSMLRTDKSEQGRVDREELSRFSALLPEERASVNIGAQFPGASQTAHYQMQALQNSVKAKLQGGLGEPLHEFDSQIKGVAEQLKFQKQDADDLKAQMDAWYLEQQRENNGKLPSRQDVNSEIARRLEHHDGSWFFNSGAKYRFQSGPEEEFVKSGPQPYETIQKAAGVSTGGTQLSAPKPRTPAAPAGRVTRTDPNTGETRTWDGQKWVLGG